MDKSKESMEATGMKAKQESDIRIKGRREEEVFVMHLFIKGQCRMFFSFVSVRDRQSDGETWVEQSGHN